MNVFTAIFCGFAVFGMLGFMASNLHIDVSEVVQNGPGLAFIGKNFLHLDVSIAIAFPLFFSFPMNVTIPIQYIKIYEIIQTIFIHICL